MPIKSIDISPEESSTNITINIIDDGFAEARETFTVSVQASVVGHIIFSRQDIEVEVIDNEGMLCHSNMAGWHVSILHTVEQASCEIISYRKLLGPEGAYYHVRLI